MKNIRNLFDFLLVYADLLVKDLDESEMTIISHPGMNHPAWILGHVTIGLDFVAKLTGQEMATDENWMKVYGPGSTPVDDGSQYPSKVELLKILHDVHARTVEILESISDEQLALPNPGPFLQKELPTTGDLILHLVTTHVAVHLGQLSAWRRCVDKKSVLGI